MTILRESSSRIDAIRRRDAGALKAVVREEAVDDIKAVVNARFDTAGRWLRPPNPTDAADHGR